MNKFIAQLLSLALIAAIPATWAREPGRYFYEGDGRIALKNTHSGKKANVTYRRADGQYDAAALRRINQLFGMPSHELGEGVDLRLISMLDYLQDRYSPGNTLLIQSGYRSPVTNATLRKKGRLAAKTSYHMYGMAADIVLPGAKAKEVWEDVRQLHAFGIGEYGGRTLHVDAGKPRFWDATTAIPKDEGDQENKNIFIAPDKDIYLPGEAMRLFMAGISNYPFGITVPLKLLRGGKKIAEVLPHHLKPDGLAFKECYMVENLKAARFIYWRIPQNLRPDKSYGIEVAFCNVTYSKMPPSITSKPFQVR